MRGNDRAALVQARLATPSPCRTRTARMGIRCTRVRPRPAVRVALFFSDQEQDDEERHMIVP
jgi:hypothetical protein